MSGFTQDLPVGKAVIKPDSKGLQAADGDDDEAPKDEEMAPTGRLPDYPPLAQDKGDHAPEATADLVEAVFRLPQQQDAVELFDGNQKKARAAIKMSPKIKLAGKCPGCMNNASDSLVVSSQ